MLVHPEVQRKAQDEIDRVVGVGRLPDFSDRDSLPYLDCVIQECRRYGTAKSSEALFRTNVAIRWNPNVVLGMS